MIAPLLQLAGIVVTAIAFGYVARGFVDFEHQRLARLAILSAIVIPSLGWFLEAQGTERLYSLAESCVSQLAPRLRTYTQIVDSLIGLGEYVAEADGP